MSPPFIKCPKCGENSFGILSINSHRYYRRCAKCFYPQGNEPSAFYPLPDLNKKIIYIDQFVLSEMMKALNPSIKGHSNLPLRDFWVQLFSILDKLCKFQLIVCPESEFHTDESLISPFYKSLKRMYGQLSCGVSFYDQEAIKRSQLLEHATNWISNNPEKPLSVNVKSVTHGEINTWQGRFIFSANLHYSDNLIDAIRNDREQIYDNLERVFNRWKTEKGIKSFDEWFLEEADSWGELIYKGFIKYIDQINKGEKSRPYFAIDYALLPKPVKFIEDICHAFKRYGLSDEEIINKTIEYLHSPALRTIPFIKISSLILAGVARRAACGGLKKPPNKGFNYDVQMISTLLPYCDAMFIDNECHSLLRERPLCDRIEYGTRFFSQNTKEDFLVYLNEIEKNMPVDLLDKVKKVYGENWGEPYLDLYKAE